MSQAAPAAPRRPLAVTLIGCLLILICLMYVIEGVTGLSTTGMLKNALANTFNTQGALSLQAQTALENTLDLLRGGVALILLIGFFRLRRWAWVGIMLWTALALLRQLFHVFVGEPTYFWMFLEVLAVFALTQSDVQKIFGIKRDEHDPLTASLNSIDGQ